MEPVTSDKTISVQKLLGVDQRAKFGAGELGAFDKLIGFYTPNIGLLKQVPGKEALQYIADSGGILEIYQTNDSRKNIIIQGRNHVYIMSENEFFNRPITTNLTPVPLTEEEDMAQAIIAHVVAGVNGGGGSTVINTFTTAVLNQIVSQFNADGTAAAFVTGLAANVFTLATGWYRIRGWSLAAHAATGHKVWCRLVDNGSGLALWNGLLNQDSEQVETVVATRNVKMEFGGVFHAAVPTAIRLDQRMDANSVNIGMGNPEAIGGFNDIYRWIEILRTGP